MVKSEGLGRCTSNIGEFRFDESLPDPPSDSKTKAWLRRLKKQLHKDVSIGVVGNFITTLLVCLLTYTYLGGGGEIPSGWRLVVVQKAIFSFIPIIGPYLFLIIAVLFLADTWWLATADQVSRVHTDALVNIVKIKSDNQKKIYIKVVVALTGITFATMFTAQPRALLVINGIINSLAMIIVIGSIYFIASIGLKKWWQPSRFMGFVLALSGMFYLAGFVLYIVLGR